MKKRIFATVIIALFLLVHVQGQLLWKVSENGLPKACYLFGTHHLIGREQIKGFDKILALCGQQEAVVGEIDATDMASVQAKIMQRVVMQGKNIKELMSAEDYTLVDTELKQLLGVGLDQLGTMKPMVLQTMYVGLVYLRSQNLEKQPEAIDVLFEKNARENNKPVIGLETVEQQAAIIFDSLSVERQAEILVKSVKEKQKGIGLLKRLNACYLAGDLKGLSELDKEDEDMTPAEKKLMYDNRNADWMKQLPGILHKQSCFVAVGCMHLAGDSGLINQLRKAGYTLEAVTDL